MQKHIVITGARQAGKSTLANRYLERVRLPYEGYRTKRISVTEVGSTYGLEDIRTGKMKEISACVGHKICGIQSTFDDFGTKVVRMAMESDVPILLLDEIGRFEKNSMPFLKALEDTFSSGKQVIAVLKKEELPHIVRIRQRKDIVLLDLDETSREQAWEQLQKEMGLWSGCGIN